MQSHPRWLPLRGAETREGSTLDTRTGSPVRAGSAPNCVSYDRSWGVHQNGAGTDSPRHGERKRTMSAVPEFEFRTSNACKYNNNDPRCVEVATNVPGKVAVRNSETGRTVEFTAVEWTEFLTGAKLGDFDLSA